MSKRKKYNKKNNSSIQKKKVEEKSILNVDKFLLLAIVAVVIWLHLFLPSNVNYIDNVINHRVPLDSDSTWFDNVFYNTVSGQGFMATNPQHYDIEHTYETKYHYWNHFQPIFFLVLPIYALFPEIYTLITLQTILIAFGAIPLYLLGREVTDKYTSLCVAIGYLLYPSILHSMMHIHLITFAPLFLFTLIYLFKKKYFIPFIITLLLTLSLKENLPLVLIPLAIFFLFDSKYTKVLSSSINESKKYIISMLLITGIWFVIVIFILIPALHPVGYYPFLDRFRGDSSAPLDVITSEKGFSYYSMLLKPVSYLPIFSPEVLIIALPNVLLNLLTKAPQTVLNYHYQYCITPILFVSVLFTFNKLKKILIKYKVKYTNLIIVISSTIFIYMLWYQFCDVFFW